MFWLCLGCVRLCLVVFGCVWLCSGCVLVVFVLSLGPGSVAAAVAAAAAVKKAATAVGVAAVCALQGLTAALDRDHARPHTIVLVTAQMADMTVVLGNGDTLLELVIRC